MPVRTDGTITAVTYRSAAQISGSVIETMKRDPRSNILLAKLEKYRVKEARGETLQADEFWIVCTTSSGSQRTIDFVLSCTHGVIGKYPIFIYGTKLEHELTDEYLELRMKNIVRELRKGVSPRRVYSIFAVEPVAESFARHWSESTAIGVIEEPYYSAKFSYCVPSTLIQPPPADHSVVVRLATEGDIARVAQLCFGFAAESPPFQLTPQGATTEATQLVRARQLWVLEDRHGRDSIACIVALTRANATVTAITKVYTPPDRRQRGFAFRLVHDVCNHLFNVERKRYVVLYVGHDNPAAKVYNRLGFVGLQPGTSGQYKLVENWLELGFERAKVDLGHW